MPIPNTYQGWLFSLNIETRLNESDSSWLLQVYNLLLLIEGAAPDIRAEHEETYRDFVHKRAIALRRRAKYLGLLFEKEVNVRSIILLSHRIAAQEHLHQQGESWLQKAQNWNIPKPIIERPYTEKSILQLKEHVEGCIHRIQCLPEMKQRAAAVQLSLPSHSEIVKSKDNFEELQNILKRREALWSEYKQLEESLHSLGWKYSFPLERRSRENIVLDRRMVLEQRKLLQEYKAIPNVDAIPWARGLLHFPIDKSMLNQAREEIVFQKDWKRQLTQMRATLAPWDRHKVPEEAYPISAEEIEIQLQRYRVLLLRGRIWSFLVLIFWELPRRALAFFCSLLQAGK